MPKHAKKELKEQAKKKGLTGDRYNAYVYGTLDKIEKERKKGGKK